MNEFAPNEEPLFDDLIESARESSVKPPFYHTFKLLDFWDFLTHGESNTTLQVRIALRKDFAEMGISD